LEDVQDQIAMEYDLRNFRDDLREYEKYFYKHGVAEFFVPYQGVLLTWTVEESWYEKFLEKIEEARFSADKHHLDEINRLRLAIQSKLDVHLLELGKLIHDEKFMALASKKATSLKSLYLYAKSVAPQPVKALGDTRSREEVATLMDKIRLGL
jgi:hypothetical protein